MKNIQLFSGFVVAFSVTSVAFLAQAKADVCRNYTVKDPKDPTVNLRATPNGSVVRSLRNGTQVTATEAEKNGWFLVRVIQSGATGWISTSRLTQNRDYVIFDPNDNSANIRKQPNGQVIGRVPNGTTIKKPTNYVGDWASVPQFNGFINRSLIREPDCSP